MDGQIPIIERRKIERPDRQRLVLGLVGGIGLTLSLFTIKLPIFGYINLIHFLLGILITILAILLTYLYYSNREHRATLTIMERNYNHQLEEQKIAEESRQKLEKALLQGQKLQAIGTLAGGIAHDFNNVLYAIMGYTELTLEDIPSDSITHQNLTKVLEASKRGQELVSRILAFSRRHHHDFKPIPIKETLDSVLDLLRPTIPASVIVNFQPAAENSIILGNQTQLHQVIVNLITNAVDAMEGEGKIVIQTERMTNSDALTKYLPDAPLHQYYCKITVTDTGHGMDAATIERIFEPFFTTKEVGRGTGLGLSTAHSIITEHKGDIFVHSQPGQGATFTILLPEYNGELTHG